MNRCKISVEFYQNLVSHIKLGDGLRKERLWVSKWKPTLERGMLFYKGKHIIPKEAVDHYGRKFGRHPVGTGCPVPEYRKPVSRIWGRTAAS